MCRLPKSGDPNLGSDHPKMSESDLKLLGMTDHWDESRRWARVAFGCAYKMPQPGDRRAKPASPYPGDHVYQNRKTGEEVTILSTHARYWRMPASVDAIGLLLKLDGVRLANPCHVCGHVCGGHSWRCSVAPVPPTGSGDCDACIQEVGRA